jgi:hypothetical protein
MGQKAGLRNQVANVAKNMQQPITNYSNKLSLQA